MNNNFLLKFSYSTVFNYLKNNYNDSSLFKNNILSIKELALQITASFFHTDKNEQIYFLQNYDFSNLKRLKKSDQEFLIYKAVKEKVDQAIEFEMLKYDLISVEEYTKNQK